MGAKIYGGTTIGPYCKAGGEISNSVMMGYSNKGHDGFLGNSVLGFWCNLGADTNTSNLKNNYDEVRLWDYASERFAHTGLQFCGLIMGDHSKCAINTAFNTGTVVGVSANVFGAGFPKNFIPSFSWGGAGSMTTYSLNKAVETAKRVMLRRGIEWTAQDQGVFEAIFETSKSWRRD
jgi:UDP-N-acetylglucosamine diphosphorylase/glucosamine-1-phosphate N-acetyltransferase